MASPIKFGTDGWRAVIGEEYTFANVRIVAQAVADLLHAERLAERGLIVGYDTRFASERFAAACAEVLAANGIHTYLTGKATPTPVISYAILHQNAGGAAIITASHNPSSDNGFKYKPEYAGSASPAVIGKLEALLEANPVKRLNLADAERQGLVERIDAMPAYVQQITTLVDLDLIKRSGKTIIVDAMFGAGAGYLPTLLDGGATKIIPINSERNPLFPGIRAPEPIDSNLAKLKKVVKESGADVGIAFDGDADRVGMATEEGIFVNQLQVYGLLYWYLLEVRGLIGPAVYTVTTTSMARRLAEIYGTTAHETGVGFKFVGPKMTETDAVIGGEESGGFGFGMHIPERDGIASGLFLIDLWLTKGKAASEVLAELQALAGPSHYDRADIRFAREGYDAVKTDTLARLADEAPTSLAGQEVVERKALETNDGFKFYRADGSWLLIRFSGTEALLRVYVEARSSEDVEALLAEGRRIANAGR